MICALCKQPINGDQRTVGVTHYACEVQLTDSWRADLDAVTKQRDALLRIAKEATNGWACYARTNKEHDEIARLHDAIATAEGRSAATSPATSRHQPFLRVILATLQLLQIALQRLGAGFGVVEAGFELRSSVEETGDGDGGCAILKRNERHGKPTFRCCDRSRIPLSWVTRDAGNSLIGFDDQAVVV